MGFISSIVDNYTASFYDIIVEYVDTEYSLWLTWFLTPVIVTFLLPGVIILLIYASSIIFHLIKLYRLRVVTAGNDWRHAARIAVCALWDAHGWLWHGYEIEGLENIPDGPFLVIYYHGALPIDMYYFTARILLFKRRLIHTVADRFMFKIPGWSTLLEGLCVIPGTVATCAGVLQAGNPLAISPGGVYEAQFGDHFYRLNWKNRLGFAKVALEAKVPIVPMFTENVREAFRTVGWLRGICLRIYAATRVPLAPVYGGFPVKLRTHLGAPLPHDPRDTPESLQIKVAQAIEQLVDKHQRIPGSILMALIERVYKLPKKTAPPTSNGKCNGAVKECLEKEGKENEKMGIIEKEKGTEKVREKIERDKVIEKLKEEIETEEEKEKEELEKVKENTKCKKEIENIGEKEEIESEKDTEKLTEEIETEENGDEKELSIKESEKETERENEKESKKNKKESMADKERELERRGKDESYCGKLKVS